MNLGNQNQTSKLRGAQAERVIKQAVLKQNRRFKLDAKLVLVGYGLVDLVLAWLRLKLFVAQALESEISLIRTPFAMLTSSILLLIAAAALRLNRTSGNVGALIASAGLCYHLLHKWHLVASAIESSMWSRTTLKYWWTNAGAIWEIPRLIVGAAIFGWAAILVLRFLKDRVLGLRFQS